MKISTKNYRANAAAAVAATLVAAFLAGPVQAGTTSDAWITTKAKLNLMTSEGIDSAGVNIDTVNRQITLHGTVATAEEKSAAEAAVKSVAGVTGVRNLLQVVKPARQDAVERADAEISKEVTAALSRKGSLEDSTISVQSVNKGVVLLEGNAQTMTDRLTAVQTAAAVPGVRRVASEIEGPETLADADIWKDDEERATVKVEERGTTAEVRADAREAGRDVKEAAKDTGSAVKDTAKDAGRATKDAAESAVDTTRDAADATVDAASDVYVTSMVKMRLLADRETPAMDINVDTQDGKVVLFGIVPSAEAKAEAEVEARRVDGVKSVSNRLQVVAEAKKEAVTAQDAEVATSVKTNLGKHEALKNVDIDVKNCIVRLTGTVPSGEERVEAMQVARATRGVCAVQNDLRFN